jgi:hypothetical protein
LRNTSAMYPRYINLYIHIYINIYKYIDILYS